ncbi:neurexin-4-like [Ylistrum balloti]|uniref:neurexin-4-like n=1 Tax=Ylistrum balloti TaxID=509963 RepID=UPI002905A34B|nr:neurexin-4-like [Ylistrum balloti]
MAQMKGLILILAIICQICHGYVRDKTPYRDTDCLDGTPVGIGVDSGSRIPDGNMWASSSTSSIRLPARGRLMETAGSWTSKVQNSAQYLGIDLGREYLLTRLQTQGRQGTDEYVTEFMLSFSVDRKTWRFYSNEFGIREMFIGNSNGDMVKTNTLKYPVVARYVRFHPSRWNMVISMRVEVQGCPYNSQTVRFDGGTSYISYDLSRQVPPPSSIEDNIKLRFKTNKQDGVILFADGNQGDYLSLELVGGTLYFHLDLGSTTKVAGTTDQLGGNMLDDSQWHDIIIRRNRTTVMLIVDRMETRFESNGAFYRLNVDKKIYIGGVPSFDQQGLTVKTNFAGCLENVVFNSLKIIRDAQAGQTGYQMVGSVPDPWNCKFTAPIPMTFFTFDSFAVLKGFDAGGAIRLQFDFRTHDEDGILLHHDMEDGGSIEVKLDGVGYVTYKLVTKDNQIIEDMVRNTALDAKSQGFADGLWHSFHLHANEQMLNITVDRNAKVSRRSLTISAGSTYYLGGYTLGISFRGCMRSIEIDVTPVDLNSISSSDTKDVEVGTCGLVDRCTPNPCEHDGVCTQDWSNFNCDCQESGYTGEVCHISSYYLSCEMYKMYTKNDGLEPAIIDPDGSGPLKPFKVQCNGKNEVGKPVETWIGHDSEEDIRVDGYQAPNYYVRKIGYSASSIDELTEVIERSVSCHQTIEYKCNNSRLLAKPNDSPDLHYAWWVGRTFQPMYYWGGAAPGSDKCYCGLTEKGCTGGLATCNCDSGLSTSDSGQLVHKEYLPVMELHFGDTGTTTDSRLGFHKVGPLICQGDNLLDNVITFRKADATIKLATFEAEPSGDIWFQFKTTAMDGVIIHNIGNSLDGSADFIQVRLFNGDTIGFSYNNGNGIKVLEYKSTNALNNNFWHTVHVERNRKQAWLRVDNFPEKYLNEGQDEVTRALDLMGYLVVGATVEDKNGFVGCIRGLRVNGVLQDLRGLVERGDFYYGVSVNCNGKCNSNPCMNGGTCIEGYSGYTCDCAYTPWRGWMCGREVGVNLQTNYQIKYTFDKSQGLSATDFMKIRVGFTTKKKQGILLQLRDAENTEYVSLEINNSGGIKFVVDVGSERWELNTPNHGIDYTNGQQHEAKMKREGPGGRNVHLQVDNYPEAIDTLGASLSDSILNNPKYLFVGSNDTKNSAKGFEGCIYRMQVDNIYPLKRAFQDPRPSFVQLNPTGKVREDMCGFEEITKPPDPIETRPVAGGPYTNITFPYSDDGLTATERGIIGGVVALIFLIIIILAIIGFIYFREKGDYSTKEAKGQDLADNPDTAVVYNQTGVPDIAKRREWFI